MIQHPRIVPTVDLFNAHAGRVERNGTIRYFRTVEAAEKFLSIVGKRTSSQPVTKSCHASDVHWTAQSMLRAAGIPECVRKALLKGKLRVTKATPPDVPRPPLALVGSSGNLPELSEDEAEELAA